MKIFIPRAYSSGQVAGFASFGFNLVDILLVYLGGGGKIGKLRNKKKGKINYV